MEPACVQLCVFVCVCVCLCAGACLRVCAYIVDIACNWPVSKRYVYRVYNIMSLIHSCICIYPIYTSVCICIQAHSLTHTHTHTHTHTRVSGTTTLTRKSTHSTAKALGAATWVLKVFVVSSRCARGARNQPCSGAWVLGCVHAFVSVHTYTSIHTYTPSYLQSDPHARTRTQTHQCNKVCQWLELTEVTGDPCRRVSRHGPSPGEGGGVGQTRSNPTTPVAALSKHAEQAGTGKGSLKWTSGSSFSAAIVNAIKSAAAPLSPVMSSRPLASGGERAKQRGSGFQLRQPAGDADKASQSPIGRREQPHGHYNGPHSGPHRSGQQGAAGARTGNLSQNRPERRRGERAPLPPSGHEHIEAKLRQQQVLVSVLTICLPVRSRLHGGPAVDSTCLMPLLPRLSDSCVVDMPEMHVGDVYARPQMVD